MPVYYQIVRPPEALWNDGKVSETVLDSYLLDTLGYDCVLDASHETTDGILFKQFSQIHQTGGTRVFARAPEVKPVSVVDALFSFLAPFSSQVWGCLLAMMSLSAAMLSYLDRPGQSQSQNAEWSERDAGFVVSGTAKEDRRKPGRLRAALGGMTLTLYRCCLQYISTNAEQMVVRSPEGRAFNVFFSFGALMTSAFYIASLASILSAPPAIAALIGEASDFILQNAKACVLNTTESMNALAQLPSSLTSKLALTVINSSRISDLFDAVVGTPKGPAVCAGGFVDSLQAAYLLQTYSAADGCKYGLTGPTLGSSLYAIAFRADFDVSHLNALTALTSYAVLTDGYSHRQEELNTFSSVRPQCAVTSVLEKSGESITLIQFAGIFLLVSIGMVVSMLMHIPLARHRSRLALQRAKEAAAAGLEDGKKETPEDLLREVRRALLELRGARGGEKGGFAGQPAECAGEVGGADGAVLRGDALLERDGPEP